MVIKEPEPVSREMHIKLYNVCRGATEIIADTMELYSYLFVIEDILGHRPRELSEKFKNISKQAQDIYALTALYDDPPEGYLPDPFENAEPEGCYGTN